MKILMTTDTVGEGWDYALQLARALEPYRVKIALASMGALPNSAQEAAVRRLANVQLYPSRFKMERDIQEDPWGDVAEAGEWLLFVAERFQPDVVHLNSYAHGALSWRAPALVVGHSCVFSWWEAVWGGAPPPVWDRYRQEVTRGLRAAAMVAAPTRWMLSALEKHYGPLPRSRVVPNGRDPAALAPAAKEPFVLSVGRLGDAAKNLNVLDAIAGRLPWPVYVAGEQQHPDGGRVELGAIQPLGFVAPSELAGWFSRAAIYCLPARYEPLGLSVLEAGLAGCALVLGDIPSLRELWEDAAVFVPPHDLDPLEDTLLRLMEDAALRADLGARARTRARRFTPERMAAGYLAAYHSLSRGPLALAR